MKLGLLCGPETIRIAEKLKVNGVSVNASDLGQPAGVERFAAMKAAGLEACQIAAFGFNPLTPDLEDRRKNEQIVAAAIPQLAQTGCRDLIINGGNYHPSGYAGSHRDNFTNEVLGKIATYLEPWLALCEAHQVNLTIEPHIQCAINTPERFLQLKALLCSPYLKVTLDVCNFLTFADLWNSAARLQDICGKLKGHYESAHLKNVGAAPGTHIHVNEVPFLTGQVEWAPVIATIKRDNPHTYMILEHAKSEADADAGIAEIRKLIAQAE